MMRSTPSLKRDTAFAVLALGVVAATSILGQIATYPNLAPWYAGLVKPSFNPPNWIFAPVWTTLYALMAFALWRILRVRMPSGMHRRYMVGLFFLLLALNAAWSWMFFWAHSPLLGLINIVPQLGVVITTVVNFARVDRLAAFCLLPLAAWVAFAGVLNTAIWLLNN
ncbi:MAG: TspO/MBR family protein [Pseudolabrys sp.]|jgi:tryptophan-rich sensory protein